MFAHSRIFTITNVRREMIAKGHDAETSFCFQSTAKKEMYNDKS